MEQEIKCYGTTIAKNKSKSDLKKKNGTGLTTKGLISARLISSEMIPSLLEQSVKNI